MADSKKGQRRSFRVLKRYWVLYHIKGCFYKGKIMLLCKCKMNSCLRLYLIYKLMGEIDQVQVLLLFLSITKSCLTFCDPMDCSQPDSSIHGISQARILEYKAISFYRGSSWPRDWTYIHDNSVGKEPACNAGDPRWISGSGRYAGEGIRYSLQYSWASLWLSW